MGKLHQVLAVEGDLQAVADKVMAECSRIFEKQSHFSGYERTLNMFDDERKNEEEGHSEKKEVDSTVMNELTFVSTQLAPYYDILLQKEATNQDAVADLIVDGKTLGEKLPATFLLGMEKRLQVLRRFFDNIPTTPPGKKWKQDEAMQEGILVAEPDEYSFKTEKTIKFETIAQATKEHPAQIHKWDDTRNIGQYTKRSWTGCITPYEKSEIMKRLDKLYVAVKKARQKANDVEVRNLKIGEDIFAYLFNK